MAQRKRPDGGAHVTRHAHSPALRPLRSAPRSPAARQRPAKTDQSDWSSDPLARFAEILYDAWKSLDLGHLSGINAEVGERLRRIPTHLNAYGYDRWGFNTSTTQTTLVITTLLYRYYFRAESHGIDGVPAGRVLLIGNHAGQVALDAAMISTALFLEGEPPRIVRGMGEYWLPTVPFVNELMVRTGSVVGTPKNCIDLLRNEEAVIAFPEGVRGMNKLFRQRYRLQRFGHGFMRLALSANAPIVPVAVVGSEEQAPGIANLETVGRLFGMPAFPVTLTWPLLGPLGLLPFPVKYRIYFGQPLHFEGDPDDEDSVIAKKVEKVKDTIQGMLDQGVRERSGIFF